jgi:hypothetical protein
MKKTFDAVEFQRERRAELSRKLAKMTPEEAIEYFRKSVKPMKKKDTKSSRHRT